MSKVVWLDCMVVKRDRWPISRPFYEYCHSFDIQHRCSERYELFFTQGIHTNAFYQASELALNVCLLNKSRTK